MFGRRVIRSLAALVAALIVIVSYSAQTVAQSTDQDTQARIRALQQQLDEINKQLQSLKEQQAKTAQQASAAAQQVSTAAKQASAADKALTTFLKGFFGTLDISIDATTKGMDGLVAYGWSLAPGVSSPGGPFVRGASKAPPFGRTGWLGMMSSNGSNIGYRGTHPIGKSGVDFIYQVATALNMAAAPGLQNTWTKSSNTVQGAIGLGDTYIGFQSKVWGRVRLGELFTPYKTSTDRLNPFSGQLGDYSVVMGNSGGDNRVEFGTRMDHVIAYSSPVWQGFSFDAAYAFGQNPDEYNNLMPLGSPDCSGSNNPGSGNLFLSCDDGGFQDAYSVDFKYELAGLYLVGAYEIHKRVNRSSDGDGSNNPYYAYLVGLGNGVSPLIDWADYNAYFAEYPGAAVAGSPEYSVAYDVADEWAAKVGGQYHFDWGLTISYMWEKLKRKLPQVMEFQDERSRNGDWLAIDYVFNGGADRIAVGWAHAGKTPGDPGGQHNYNPTRPDDEGNMYTIAWWHKIDKQLTWYFDAADSVNDGNVHYDIGAGGHGIKTDCHDATHALFIDYSSAGPTTWGGCHEIGVSTGINFKF